jgi:butyryl-CoA dehydrogenase
MFQMMNEARLGVGMNAVAIATAAYLSSLTYAKERPQGRKINEKDISKPQVPIIEHADVKRMLLFQKSITEGSLALLLYCAMLSDRAVHETDEIRKKEIENLLDLLTPIAKSYPSEMGIQSTSAAVQVLGGAGYTNDFPVEQYYREARIHPIHEGTTGIHGLDILGRKLLINKGQGWELLKAEIDQSIHDLTKYPALDDIRSSFENQYDKVKKTSKIVVAKSADGAEIFLADATLFLEMFGILTIGWMWIRQAKVSLERLEIPDSDRNFYLGKIETTRYFVEYELVKITSLSERLSSNSYPTIEMKKDWF